MIIKNPRTRNDMLRLETKTKKNKYTAGLSKDK